MSFSLWIKVLPALEGQLSVEATGENKRDLKHFVFLSQRKSAKSKMLVFPFGCFSEKLVVRLNVRTKVLEPLQKEKEAPCEQFVSCPPTDEGNCDESQWLPTSGVFAK